MSANTPETGELDIMNDPSYETNQRSSGKSPDESDTCRICRGEGSKEEPLFFPCKCSGSIKYVHQSCLMEWLSHSQKKHCELCKTSFRFTKLYHPQMPSTVPLPIFLRQAALHTFRSFLTWARWHLVIFVWLGWVPWCMRTVWRGLFWVGDGGWVDWHELQRHSSQEQLNKLMGVGISSASGNLVTPKNIMAFEIVSRVSSALHPLWPAIPHSFNFSNVEPAAYRFAHRLFKGMFYQSSTGPTTLTSSLSQNQTSVTRAFQRSPSLLSELSFLRTLTRWPTINNLVMDILEGQLITLFVVVAFVLIFLIREWVVQQQPAIQMGEAFVAAAAAAAAAERPLVEAPAPPLANQGNAQLDLELAPRLIEAEDAARRLPLGANGRPARLIARPRPVRRATEQPDGQGQEEGQDSQRSAEKFPGNNPISGGQADTVFELPDVGTSFRPRSSSDVGPSTSLQRPSMPTRDALAYATEIQRTMEEHSRASGQEWPGINVFKDLWKRGDSNPSEVLRIIREERREDELGWIVLAMRRLEHASSDENPRHQAYGDSASLAEQPPGEQHSDTSTDSWQVLEDPADSNDRNLPIPELEAPDKSNVEETCRGPVTDNDATSKLDPPDSEPTEKFSAQNLQAPLSQAQARPGADGSDWQWHFDDVDNPSLEKDAPVEGHSSDSHVASENDDPTNETIPEAPPRATTPSPGLDMPLVPDARRQPHTEIPPEAQVEAHRDWELLETITEWLWGGMAQPITNHEEQGQDDEHVVRDIGNEAPFVPFNRGQLVIQEGNEDDNAVPDPEVLRAAAEAGIDPNDAEAIEDAEDLEGVMELIGMQGPLAGLVQNGMFSAVLISMTVFFGIWIPYIAGKLLLVFLANPISLFVKLPLRWASIIAEVITDTCVFVVACAFYWTDTAIRWVVTPVGWFLPFLAKINQNQTLSTAAWRYGTSAGERLLKMFSTTSNSFSDSDIPVFSIIAHESLKNAEQRLADITMSTVTLGKIMMFGHSNTNHDSHEYWKDFGRTIAVTSGHVLLSTYRGVQQAAKILPALLKVNLLRINLEIPQRVRPLDYSLVEWNTRDRVIAIFLGYLAFSVAGAIYLRIRAAFQEHPVGEKRLGTIADVLSQAAGVMKVILIIGIEMIVFPLYCGLLLDGALLPLFEGASVVSRVQFTINSPITSLFIHWFVGTCYMFHFALFVSMCRKIMRSGVLYFIRDPDDPTFHPVRDVLERNVTTQLRKIAFSALVYGALVIVCLGGVVWGLAYILDGVFPIHWSSNEPVLEFPVDLLVYNFLMPLAVKFFRPSKLLNIMYDWWFRKCARLLRLSHFLFGDKRADEEGRHVRHSWWDLLSRKQGDPQTPIMPNRKDWADDRKMEAYFLMNGRFVRAPASDQVRIPKETNTFVDIDELGFRTDGRPETHEGLHGRENHNFTAVYIPPNFRFRIGVFIALIWLFAATTGLCITILPLLFGRYVFSYLIPSHLRMNDVYAFSIGIYLLGGPLYLLINYRARLNSVLQALRYHLIASKAESSQLSTIAESAGNYVIRTLRLTYFYAAFTLLLPSLFALLMEAYLVIPLHTYFSPAGSTPPRHTIHFIQDWTLGVLYLKMAGRLLLWRHNTRPAIALRGIVAGPRHSWLNPDIRLATRAVILPATVVMMVLLLAPVGVAWVALQTVCRGRGENFESVVYRYAYPSLASLAAGFGGVWEVGKQVRGWRGRVRDEVYLIGERLHNFGEKRAGGVMELVDSKRAAES